MLKTVNVSIKQYPELFLNANAYKEIFYELLTNPNKLGTECNSISAIMVNGLLAAELYLKYLISFDQAEKNLGKCKANASLKTYFPLPLVILSPICYNIPERSICFKIKASCKPDYDSIQTSV